MEIMIYAYNNCRSRALVIAFIYSRIAEITFLTAIGKIIKGIGKVVLGFFSIVLSDKSSLNRIKSEAKKQGRDDVVERVNQEEARRNQVKERIDNLKDKL